MNDRAVALLEKYDVEVLGTRKGRGSILCDTDKGCLIFKEYSGNESRIRLQDQLLKHIAECEAASGTEGSNFSVERIIPTKEEELLVQDNDGIRYVLKTYKEGRECNIYDKTECMEAVRLLARLHKCMEFSAKEENDIISQPIVFSPSKEYEKRNKELKRARKYLQQRSQKTWFEISLLNTYNLFLEQALSVTEEWEYYQKQASAGDSMEKDDNNCVSTFCHGDYQYHNILFSQGGWFLMNFEKCMADNPIRDLYLLMRKLLEKSNWSIALGKEILETYESVRPISAICRIDLYYRLAYPEKFWKIVNFYYNSGKAWIPERNQEKLNKIISQEPEKQKFLEEVFRKV